MIKEKPCHKLGWCPYGILVEEFPLRKEFDKKSCIIFGHDCPVFTCAEDVSEDRKKEIMERDMKKFKEEKKNARMV